MYNMQQRETVEYAERDIKYKWPPACRVELKPFNRAWDEARVCLRVSLLTTYAGEEFLRFFRYLSTGERRRIIICGNVVCAIHFSFYSALFVRDDRPLRRYTRSQEFHRRFFHRDSAIVYADNIVRAFLRYLESICISVRLQKWALKFCPCQAFRKSYMFALKPNWKQIGWKEIGVTQIY